MKSERKTPGEWVIEPQICYAVIDKPIIDLIDLLKKEAEKHPERKNNMLKAVRYLIKACKEGRKVIEINEH